MSNSSVNTKKLHHFLENLGLDPDTAKKNLDQD
jgi:hypothetical protein